MLADLAFFLLDGIQDAWDAVANLLTENELAETDGKQDADGGKHEIQDVGVLKVDA